VPGTGFQVGLQEYFVWRRGQRKLLHALLQILAVTCAVFGVTAAFQSHNLKRPDPTPNLYSPHSYLGVLTLIFLGLQV
jgi:hypothetical protein